MTERVRVMTETVTLNRLGVKIFLTKNHEDVYNVLYTYGFLYFKVFGNKLKFPAACLDRCL